MSPAEYQVASKAIVFIVLGIGASVTIPVGMLTVGTAWNIVRRLWRDA